LLLWTVTAALLLSALWRTIAPALLRTIALWWTIAAALLRTIAASPLPIIDAEL
jgi:hypothetical protein